MSEFTFEAMVRGYHVYHEIWTAAVGEEVSCLREKRNESSSRAPWLLKGVRSSGQAKNGGSLETVKRFCYYHIDCVKGLFSTYYLYLCMCMV